MAGRLLAVVLTAALAQSTPPARAEVGQLRDAVCKGDVPSIERLVAAGASPNAVASDGASMLFAAVRCGRKPSYVRLLELGADPNLDPWPAEDRGGSVVFLVAALKDPEWLQIALKHGGNSNAENRLHETPLHAAVASYNVEQVDQLLAAGAAVDHPNSLGQTPAMGAALARSYDVLLRLLQAGASCRVRDRNGEDLAGYVEESPTSAPHLVETRRRVIAHTESHCGGER